MEAKRKLIFVCSGSDCKKAGIKSLKKELKQAMKEGELKGQCKMITTKCMDFCKSAPVMIVGNHICKKATKTKVLEQIKKP
ncbi:(2Fe-2S) ferredoxin domain-containing protein [Algoriphagus machipongonensis]|uniref:NAD-reducing hydrogenase, alpha subunit n=1 Tax=Algoriphagus machipongonensis TaxID=388413 RepID=A3I2Z9_9BACT|nr:(2Fe-2S) ferredoxin domain-containing protein [Algoriphagus machipongonensis]EAZ79198.1 NAD-reducing hydrogenase, alpha subunit [Algoriphagus machipongonensis]